MQHMNTGLKSNLFIFFKRIDKPDVVHVDSDMIGYGRLYSSKGFHKNKNKVQI